MNTSEAGIPLPWMDSLHRQQHSFWLCSRDENGNQPLVPQELPAPSNLPRGPARRCTWLGFLSFYIRTSLDPEQLFPSLSRVVGRLDPNLPVENLRTMPQQVRENVYLDRMIGVLSTAFACLATLLAAVGLYGVLAYTVAQRTREIGLRMALGASPGRVRTMVLRQVGLMTIVGGLLGLTLAVWLGRFA